MFKIMQVDAFTAEPFRGNPAVVCLMTEEKTTAWMQQVAFEMNQSETAFVLKKGNEYSLRWFTPAVEVELCGHATLATAHALWETGWLKPEETAVFQTLSGKLTAKKNGNWICLDFPTERETKTEMPPSLVEAIGATPVYVGKNRMDFLVELSSEAAVRAVKPNQSLLETLPTRGVIITARAETGSYDFVSRFLGVRGGYHEDPVTGSAHCCLGPYWSGKLNKSEMVGFQASARGGYVKVRVKGERTELAGQAVTIFEGTLK